VIGANYGEIAVSACSPPPGEYRPERLDFTGKAVVSWAAAQAHLCTYPRKIQKNHAGVQGGAVAGGAEGVSGADVGVPPGPGGAVGGAGAAAGGGLRAGAPAAGGGRGRGGGPGRLCNCEGAE